MKYRDRPKRLYRSSDDRVFLGVCGGIAQHYDFSAWGVRLFFILVTMFTFPFSILGYVLMGLIMKLEPERPMVIDEQGKPREDGTRADALRRIQDRYEALERRLQRMESIVTDKNFDIEDELRRL